MNNTEPRPVGAAANRGQLAEDILYEMFSAAGWKVSRSEDRPRLVPDLVVRRGKTSYAIEVKSASEGRSDRLVPLWSQAHLQALNIAGSHGTPLAVVAAPRVPRRTAEQVLEFAGEYAPHAAAGVIDFHGLRMFRGTLLEELNTADSRGRVRRGSSAIEQTNLFSDLNQWMLKVLLAPELPEPMLTAPRGRYRNATELARAANVSVMSASRFVRQLQHGGYLHESKPYLDLVRREELFRRWQLSGGRRVKEARFRYLLRRDPRVELAGVLQNGEACLALFAAADALDLGFVHGVPPHVYVRQLGPGAVPAWKNLVPAETGETPDLIVRAAPTPNSVFRGAVTRDSVLVCDVVQVWLDVAVHPSRGGEQADLIRRKILDPVIRGGDG